MRKLIAELAKLPAIGERSATRLAYHIINSKSEDTEKLAAAIIEAKGKVRLCETCFGLTDEPICPICADVNRNHKTICVVEKPADLIAIERSGGFDGVYHVIHGLWSPLRGVGPGETKISELIKRIRENAEENGANNNSPLRGTGGAEKKSEEPLTSDSLQNPPKKIEELIIATSTTVEGDVTAMYIAKHVSAFGIKISRIAQGLPKGGELEYADQGTLTHALQGRGEIRNS